MLRGKLKLGNGKEGQLGAILDRLIKKTSLVRGQLNRNLNEASKHDKQVSKGNSKCKGTGEGVCMTTL